MSGFLVALGNVSAVVGSILFALIAIGCVVGKSSSEENVGTFWGSVAIVIVSLAWLFR